MSLTPLLAFLAAVCGVLAVWDALVAAEQARALRAAVEWARRPWPALRSGVEPASPERLRLAVVAAATLLGGGTLLSGPIAGLLLAAAGPWLVRRALLYRRRRRRARLVEQAPEVACAIADALAAGHSIHGSVAATAGASGPAGPAGEELSRAALALELGEPADAVLEGLARRVDAPAYDVLVAAILLQREAGGDLAGLLRDLAGTLRERTRAEAEARSVTAQARFTATLVTALPMGGVALAELTQPGTIAALLAAPASALMAGTALVLQVVALLLVRRIARGTESC